MRLIWRGRRAFVRKPRQRGFIAVFVGLALVISIGAAVATGVAVDRSLSAAMFRAHFGEQSTGEIVLPVLLRVNGTAAVVALVLGFGFAVTMFRRADSCLERTCVRLGQWERGLANPGLRGTAVQFEVPEKSNGWTKGLEVALITAQARLNATYHEGAEEAQAAALAARQLEAALESGDMDSDAVNRALDSLSGHLATLSTGLARLGSERQD